MDSEKSKPILIGVAVVCLIGAGILLYANLGGGGGTGGSNEPIPMVCLACGHTAEVPVRDYREMLNQQDNDMVMMNPMATPRFACPSCSQAAFQTGVKCSGCDTIFATDFVRNPELKCPRCGVSNL